MFYYNLVISFVVHVLILNNLVIATKTLFNQAMNNSRAKYGKIIYICKKSPKKHRKRKHHSLQKGLGENNKECKGD